MDRKASIADLDNIIELKLQMHKEGGYFDVLRDDAAEFILKTYQSLYKNQQAQHFVIEFQSKIVSCTGGFIKTEMPYSFRKVPFYGYITDVYTIPEYRNKGYATLLTTQVINWLHEKGAKDIRLIATEQGRELYKRKGFIPTDEMILSID